MSARSLFGRLVPLMMLAATSSCGSRVTVVERGTGPEGAITVEATLHARCAVGPTGDDASPMLASVIDEQLFFAYESGRVEEVFRFDRPEDTNIRPEIVARGELVAAYGLVTPNYQNDAVDAFIQAVVLDTSGTIRWEERFPFDYEGAGQYFSLFGNAQGLFVFSFIESNTQLSVTVEGGAHRTWSDPFIGEANPSADGRMLMNAMSNSNADYHWFDAAAQTFAPAQ